MTRSSSGGRYIEDLAPPPQPVPPSAWLFPKPENADEDGVVGVGADLEPGTLVEAYRSGIFPWPHPGMSLPWFSPDPRGLISPASIHVSRSLRRTLRRSGWRTTVDHAFADVVRRCADRGELEDTWITPAMMRAYERLHRLGWAHSVEVWEESELVGGLYGVLVGGCFTGESMFHRRSDASKVALIELVDRLLEAGGAFVDVQIVTPHLRTLGAVERPRAPYLRALADVRDDEVRLSRSERPASRLAERFARQRQPGGDRR